VKVEFCEVISIFNTLTENYNNKTVIPEELIKNFKVNLTKITRSDEQIIKLIKNYIKNNKQCGIEDED
jgi:hypothetical protein